ncbi:MAG: GGDEF domain-containing protein [Campylobacterota bacterium]|nr:GGDEF domain-containing protein [Campylobacterota bacterium]
MRNIQIVLNAILSKNIFEYIMVDKDLKIQSTSEGIIKYVGKQPKESEDLLEYLPELVGSEDEIQEIFVKKYCLYTLESVYKNEYYVNISVEYCDDSSAIVLLHNITATTLSQQKLLQYSNESALLYGTLKKVFDNQNTLLFAADRENIKFVNQKFMDYFHLNSIEDIKVQALHIYKFFNTTLESYDELFIALNHKESYIKIDDDTFILHASLIEPTHILFTLTKVTTLTDKVQWDTHTGAYTKSYFNAELKCIVDNDTSCTLTVLDLDNFKNVNDTYGHQVGDLVLKEFASLVKSKIRDHDIFARWGGEEFVLLLTSISHDEAMSRIEDIRQTIDAFVFSAVGHMTSSFGVSHLKEEDDADTLFFRADRALYEAKKSGKNQVVIGES